MNNAVFGKTMENVRKHRDIKLVKTDKGRNQLSSEPNYHATKHFPENFMAIKMKKTKVKMNKPIYLGMSILDISKTLMYQFSYDYIKPKYQDRAKLCYMDTDNFANYIKIEDFIKTLLMMSKNGLTYQTTEKMIKDRFQQIRTRKDELGGKIMKEFVALKAKTYPYLMNDDTEHKKAKGTKKCVIKRDLMLKNYKDCLLNDIIILKL